MNNNITYEKHGSNIKTVYSIEYIDNKKDFERIERHPEPWTLFKERKTENLQEAIEWFIMLYAAERDEERHIYCVKMFESLEVNGEIVREQYINNISNFSSVIGREAKRAEEKYNNIREYSEMQNNKLSAFLKKYNAQKLWYNFKEE
jgi:hypothetical protein